MRHAAAIDPDRLELADRIIVAVGDRDGDIAARVSEGEGLGTVGAAGEAERTGCRGRVAADVAQLRIGRILVAACLAFVVEHRRRRGRRRRRTIVAELDLRRDVGRIADGIAVAIRRGDRHRQHAVGQRHGFIAAGMVRLPQRHVFNHRHLAGDRIDRDRERRLLGRAAASGDGAAVIVEAADDDAVLLDQIDGAAVGGAQPGIDADLAGQAGDRQRIDLGVACGGAIGAERDIGIDQRPDILRVADRPMIRRDIGIGALEADRREHRLQRWRTGDVAGARLHAGGFVEHDVGSRGAERHRRHVVIDMDGQRVAGLVAVAIRDRITEGQIEVVLERGLGARHAGIVGIGMRQRRVERHRIGAVGMDLDGEDIGDVSGRADQRSAIGNRRDAIGGDAGYPHQRDQLGRADTGGRVDIHRIEAAARSRGVHAVGGRYRNAWGEFELAHAVGTGRKI